MTKKWTPDPTTFPPPPLEAWGTWIAEREPRFVVHKTLALAKGAISSFGKVEYYTPRAYRYSKAYVTVLPEAWLYQWVGSSWIEIVKVAKGALKEEHPFWRRIRKGIAKEPVSTEQIEDAIASIQEAIIGGQS